MKRIILFIDSGDTLVDESSEIRNNEGVVQTAKFIPGAVNMLYELHHEGYRIALVADGYADSFRNIYDAAKLRECFEQWICSSEVGEEKTSSQMFATAMKAMGLTERDKSRIVMVENNIKRDIAGANRFGITSVLMDWTPRYSMRPICEEERPDYIIHTPIELIDLMRRLESQYLADQSSGRV